jgi:hypothetical protein
MPRGLYIQVEVSVAYFVLQLRHAVVLFIELFYSLHFISLLIKLRQFLRESNYVLYHQVLLSSHNLRIFIFFVNLILISLFYRLYFIP